MKLKTGIVCLVALFAFNASTALAAVQKTNGKITYGCEWALCSIDPANLSTPITLDGPANSSDPEWSADGKKLAFEASPADVDQIFVTDNEKSSIAQLTSDDNNGSRSPTWSPDGSQIAYIHQTAGGDQLFVMNSDGTNPHPLLDGSVEVKSPKWSPGGKLIAARRQGEKGGIVTISADGSGEVKPVEGSDEHSFRPSWSPDGLKLAFYSSTPKARGLYTVKIDGSETPKLLTGSDQKSGKAPTWSPDGTKIAFSTRTNSVQYSLSVINVDGSALTTLVPDSTTTIGAISWQPVITVTPDRQPTVASAPVPQPQSVVAAAINCRVPHLLGLSLKKAKAKLRKAHCAAGRTRSKGHYRKHSSKRRLRVIKQSVKAGSSKPANYKVKLTIGKKKSHHRSSHKH